MSCRLELIILDVWHSTANVFPLSVHHPVWTRTEFVIFETLWLMVFQHVVTSEGFCLCDGPQVCPVCPSVLRSPWTLPWGSCVSCLSAGARYRRASWLWQSGCWETKKPNRKRRRQKKLPVWYKPVVSLNIHYHRTSCERNTDICIHGPNMSLRLLGRLGKWGIHTDRPLVFPFIVKSI